jgi:protein-S-isoprenylcysteine O-methyltransferase Ste14
MRLEERALDQEFPEYAAYTDITPALIPRLRLFRSRGGVTATSRP